MVLDSIHQCVSLAMMDVSFSGSTTAASLVATEIDLSDFRSARIFMSLRHTGVWPRHIGIRHAWIASIFPTTNQDTYLAKVFLKRSFRKMHILSIKLQLHLIATENLISE